MTSFNVWNISEKKLSEVQLPIIDWDKYISRSVTKSDDKISGDKVNEVDSVVVMGKNSSLIDWPKFDNKSSVTASLIDICP